MTHLCHHTLWAIMICLFLSRCRLEAQLPDGGDALAEVVEDVAGCGAATGRKEATDDAGDVTTDVELIGLVYALAFHTEAEAADAWQYDGVAVGELHLHGVLQVGDHAYGCRTVVASGHE